MEDIPKRVMFVNGLPIDIGGIEKSIMEVYRGIERSELLIDFAVRKPQKGYFHDEIKQYGGRIFNIFENTKHKGNKKWNFFMDLYSVYSFYKILKKEGPFCAVHIAHPLLDGFLIIAAKWARIPVRIAHSRNTGIDDKNKPTFSRLLIRKLRTIVCKRYATHIWGCSKAACQYMFGKNIVNDIRMEVPKNPVYIKKFYNKVYSKSEACNILGIPHNKINFINIGRYVPQKNQLFLIDLFAEMIKQSKDLHLILVGSGSMEDDIRNRINELAINDNVSMFESDTNIPLVLAASDYFVLPSIYEGFGNVLIEAQAAGVPCFASDACQPEPNLGLIDYIPLNQGAKYWAEYILNKIGKGDTRKIDLEKLMEYDTSNVAKRMQQVYLQGIKYEDGDLKCHIQSQCLDWVL